MADPVNVDALCCNCGVPLVTSEDSTIAKCIQCRDAESEDDTSCEGRTDGVHCVHYWDGDGACCGCGLAPTGLLCVAWGCQNEANGRGGLCAECQPPETRH